MNYRFSQDAPHMIHKTSIILLVMIAFLVGCGKALDKGSATPLTVINVNSGTDTTPPTVVAFAPEGNTVSVSAKITVRFSEAIETTTVDATSFQVVTGGVPITGKISYNSFTRTFTFSPDSPLSNLTTYEVTISGTITDKAGNALGIPTTWSFKTYDLAHTLPQPGFYPVSDTYDPGTVKITYSGPAASINYTIDGTEPSPTNGIPWDGTSTPITISQNTVIKALAYGNASYFDSPVVTGNFFVHSDQPTFNYPGGTYHSDFDLMINPPSSDPSAVLYYETTTGTTSSMPSDPPDPTILSAMYTTPTPIPISGDTTVVKVKVIAVSSGKSPSAVLAGTYTISYYQVGTPTFSPAAGTYDAPQSVYINHDAGSTAYYTTDGSDPKVYGVAYDDGPPAVPIDVAVSTANPIRVYATEPGYTDSAEAAASYIINPAVSSISPNAASNTETNKFVTIYGDRFQPGATVTLTDGTSTINGTGVNVADATKITCYFNLSGATPAYWNVNVADPDTGTATLLTGFRIYADPTGVASWWKLDGDEKDYMGVNDGTNSGLVTFTTDRLGASNGAAVNSSMSDYIQATAVGLPTGSASRTMMGWFRIDSLHTGENFLFGYGMTGTMFKLYVNSLTNRLTLSEGSDIITGGTVLTTGRWYHAAVTYDQSSGTATLYLDGNIEGTATTTLATPVSGGTYLFKVPALFGYLNGALDDVMVLNTVMTQAEVQAVAANGGYLLPPTNLQTWGGASYVYLSWDPSLNATGYDVFRSSGLLSTYSQINTGTVTDTNYTDSSATPGVLYYYKVRATNATMMSDLTKAEPGFIGTYTTLTEGFEWTFAVWWDTPVYTGSADATFTSTDPAQAFGYSDMKLISFTTCTGGCGFNESLALTVTFGTPISIFNLSMYYIYTPGIDAGGNFSVYVNNTRPDLDPVTGLVPFKEQLKTGGWWQRTLNYIGDNNVGTITLVFYDLTDTVEFDADQLKINYK